MVRRAAVSCLLVVTLALSACGGRHSGPRTLAGIGTLLAVGGGTTWALGERAESDGVVYAGVGTVVLGLAAIVVAGGWMATAVSCHVDPDCAETEECREVPAPPGGVPYKQCMPRQ